MIELRRNFIKKAAFFSLGLVFFQKFSIAAEDKKILKNSLSLKRKFGKTVRLNGKICFENQSPVKNATLEFCHDNSETNPLKYDYQGEIITDAEGNYSLETDFPEKHFEEGDFKMRRIFLNIKTSSGKHHPTKLYFGENGKAFIDGFHLENMNEKFRSELPKTNFASDDLIQIQFNIYLKS